MKTLRFSYYVKKNKLFPDFLNLMEVWPEKTSFNSDGVSRIVSVYNLWALASQRTMGLQYAPMGIILELGTRIARGEQ